MIPKFRHPRTSPNARHCRHVVPSQGEACEPAVGGDCSWAKGEARQGLGRPRPGVRVVADAITRSEVAENARAIAEGMRAFRAFREDRKRRGDTPWARKGGGRGDSGRPTRQRPDSAKRSEVSGYLIAALNAGAVRHRILLETERLRVRSLADGP
jgi:hypothetical protein